MATRSQQIELLATGVLYNGAVIATPYAKFLVAGTSTAKNAYDDVNKSVAITKKALDAQGRAVVYGDGIYKIQIYSGDPDSGGVLLFTVDNYKVTAVAGNTRTITAANVTGSVDDSLVEADTTSNNITYTLPDAALMAGKIIQIAKSVAANTLTIAAAGGQMVNGAASVAYTAQYSTGVFQSNGSNWYVFQTVGDATTLSGLASTAFQLVADMTTAETANKGVLRDSSGAITGTRVFGRKDGQVAYNSSGIESRSPTGDVWISLHAENATAAGLKHVRNGNGIEVRDSAGSLARVKGANGSAADDFVTKAQIDAKSPTSYMTAVDTAAVSTLRTVAFQSVNVVAGEVVLVHMHASLTKGATQGDTLVYATKSGGTAGIHANWNNRGIVYWNELVEASGGRAISMTGSVKVETSGTLELAMYAQSSGSSSTNNGCFIGVHILR